MISNIPKEWNIDKLGNIAIIQAGGTPSRSKSEYWDGDIPWLKISDLKDKYTYQANEFITELGLKNSSTKLLEENTILYTIFATLGEVSILKKQATTNQAIAGIKLDNVNVNLEFIYYYLLSIKEKVINTGRGVAQNNINLSILRNIDTPIPPYQQQERIVKILDITSNLIEKQKQVLQNYNLFLKSKFIEMFGDPIKNPMDWEVVKFEEVLVLQRGYDLPISQRDINGNIEVFGSNGVLDYHNEAKVKDGGVITGRSGTLGKVHYTFKDYWPLNTTLFSKDLKGNNIIYLAYFLEMFKVERFTQGAGVPTLNRNLVHKEKTYKVPIDLQNKFASIVEKIEAIKEKENKKLNQLEDLHNSLMQKAFKGQIN